MKYFLFSIHCVTSAPPRSPQEEEKEEEEKEMGQEELLIIISCSSNLWRCYQENCRSNQTRSQTVQTGANSSTPQLECPTRTDVCERTTSLSTVY